MILDWSTDPDHANLYDILDAETGESHPNMDIFYADDEAGIVRYYRRDDAGQFAWAYADDPGTPLRREDQWPRHDKAGKLVSPERTIAWEEARQAIQIVRKSDRPSAEHLSVTTSGYRKDR